MDPISAISSAVGGMAAARLRMDIATAVLAKVAPMPSADGAPVMESDVAAALVDQMLALEHFRANVAVVRTSDQMTAETLRLADGLAPE